MKTSNHPQARINRVNLLGVGISAVNLKSASEIISHWIEANQREYVVVCPVYSIMKAVEEPELRRIYNGAGMVTPDGMPVAMITRWSSGYQIERVYGPDLMLEMHTLSAREGYTNYYLGGAEGIAQRVAETFKQKFPTLKTAGTYTPAFRDLTPEEEQTLIDHINAANPDILWIALGSPKQDYWMARYRPQLNARVIIAVGAAFDFYSGRIRQAPRWMQRSALEWLFRLLTEPKRLWRRYVIYNPLFIFHTLLQILGLKKYELID